MVWVDISWYFTVQLDGFAKLYLFMQIIQNITNMVFNKEHIYTFLRTIALQISEFELFMVLMWLKYSVM